MVRLRSDRETRPEVNAAMESKRFALLAIIARRRMAARRMLPLVSVIPHRRLQRSDN